MKKLILDIDALAVDSFEVDRAQGAGTVLANEYLSTTENSSAQINCICTVRCIPTQ